MTSSAITKPPEITNVAPKFHIGTLISPYDRLKPIDAYVMPLVKPAERLWGALVQSTGEALGIGTRPDGPRTGVIVASHRLIGLAAAAALDRAIQVPQRESDPALSRDELSTLQNADTSGKTFRACVEGLGEDGMTLLMRAWELSYSTLAQDFARASSTHGTAGRHETMCLLSAARWAGCTEQPHLPRLADVSTDFLVTDILVATIGRLGQPSPLHEMTGPKLRRFVEENTASAILNWLNSEDHGDFDAKAWGHVLRGRRITSERRKWIVNPDETTPRHAASLFVAAHFTGATPDLFFPLADLLASQTPARVPGNTVPREPVQVSDSVLHDCGIRFNRTSQGAQRPVISADDVSTDSTMQNESGKMPANIGNVFEMEAPLLRERYLQTLAHWLTLGHASDRIAENYRELELPALCAAAAAEPALAHDRLRGIVFGYPVSLRGAEGFLDGNRRDFNRRLQRSIQRVPDLIEKIGDSTAAVTAQMSPAICVEALCTTEPLDDDKRWTEDMHRAAAVLFWHCYTNATGRVTLRQYPAFFGNGTMSTQAAKVRRKAGLLALTDGMANSGDTPLLDQISKQMKDPEAVGQLLAECTGSRELLVEKAGAEPFASTLVGEVSSRYLLIALRGKLWNDVKPLPDATNLLRTLWGWNWLDAWLQPQMRMEGRTAWDAACVDGQFAIDADTVESRLDRQAVQSWVNAVVVLDGLLGLSALDPPADNTMKNERLGQNIFLKSQFTDRAHSDFSSYQFDDYGLWLWMCDPRNPTPEQWEDSAAQIFKECVHSLYKLYPLLLVIAATIAREGAWEVHFDFSPELKEFLTRTPGRYRRAVLDDLLILVEFARILQTDFRTAMNDFILPEPLLSQWRRLFRDREETLAAFQRALRAMIRDVKVIGVTGSSSQTANASASSPASSPTASAAAASDASS